MDKGKNKRAAQSQPSPRPTKLSRIRNQSSSDEDDFADPNQSVSDDEEMHEEEEETSDDNSDSSSSEEDEDDDGAQEPKKDYRKGGYHIVKIGDVYKRRYKVIRKLGFGVFSTVWLCMDNKKKQYAAIKVQKSGKYYVKNAEEEVKLLKAIHNGDTKDPKRNRIVQLLDHFRIRGSHGTHPCLVMEVVGSHLFRLICRSGDTGIPLNNVKTIVKQVLESLDYLHTKCKIIHTDIKPENILVKADQRYLKFLHQETEYWDKWKIPYPPEATCNVPENLKSKLSSSSGNKNSGTKSKTTNNTRKIHKLKSRTTKLARLKISEKPKAPESPDPCIEECHVEVKLADLGNSCFIDHHFTNYIQSRAYRSPEVILRAGYSTSADIWSVACTAFELATGQLLFEPSSKGGYPVRVHHLILMQELLGKMPKKVSLAGKKSHKYFDGRGCMRNVISFNFMKLRDVLIYKFNWEAGDAHEFAEFLLPMLRFDKTQRATAAECLRHPWLSSLDEEQEEEDSDEEMEVDSDPDGSLDSENLSSEEDERDTTEEEEELEEDALEEDKQENDVNPKNGGLCKKRYRVIKRNNALICLQRKKRFG